jgi:hypothetical protein
MADGYWEQATTLAHSVSTVVVSQLGGSLLAWTHRGNVPAPLDLS